MIAKTRNGEYEGIIPTGRECEAEATKITTHIVSAIMYRLIFKLDVELFRCSDEHVKVAMMHSSYEMETGTVIFHQTSNNDSGDNMRNILGED